MVRAAALVENDVPVDEAADPVAEVANDIARIAFAVLPFADALGSAFDASFGEEDVLIREFVVHP